MSVVKIENVRVLDPIAQSDRVETVYIENGKRVAAVEHVDEVLDGQGNG